MTAPRISGTIPPARCESERRIALLEATRDQSALVARMVLSDGVSVDQIIAECREHGFDLSLDRPLLWNAMHEAAAENVSSGGISLGDVIARLQDLGIAVDIGTLNLMTAELAEEELRDDLADLADAIEIADTGLEQALLRDVRLHTRIALDARAWNSRTIRVRRNPNFAVRRGRPRSRASSSRNRRTASESRGDPPDDPDPPSDWRSDRRDHRERHCISVGAG